jgi:hypothetical protein
MIENKPLYEQPIQLQTDKILLDLIRYWSREMERVIPETTYERTTETETRNSIS